MNFILTPPTRVNGVPVRVEATFGNLTLAFEKIKGRVVEVSRWMNATVYSYDEMRLVKGVYPEILRQVCGVFSSKRKARQLELRGLT